MSSVGLALTPQRYDALTVEHIPAKYWARESELYKGKWWDYRIMHPLQATYHFVQAYRAAYKVAYARRTDSEAAKWIRVFQHDDFLEGAPSTRTALWLARQQADEIGCPYTFFCNRAMHYAERRDWAMLPRPQAMYSTRPMYQSDLTIAQYVERQWQERCRVEIMHAESDFYRVENFVNNVHQRQHQRMLIERVRHLPQRVTLIGSFVYDQRLLLEEFVCELLPDGNELLARAKSLFV